MIGLFQVTTLRATPIIKSLSSTPLNAGSHNWPIKPQQTAPAQTGLWRFDVSLMDADESQPNFIECTNKNIFYIY